jgi:hypothetical protein
MNEPQVKTHADFVLPLSIVSKTDLAHLVNELERVDDELTTASVRTKVGSNESTQLSLSPSFTDFLNQNALKPSNSHERTELIKQLRLLKDTAPVIHMTFAVAADHESLQKLAQWLRTSIHPQAVISVGMQPALVAGVYLRTPNHVHDFSLRAVLEGQHGMLVKELETLRGNR